MIEGFERLLNTLVLHILSNFLDSDPTLSAKTNHFSIWIFFKYRSLVEYLSQ